MPQIVFTGAQGTGKTTMLNLFKDRFDNVITEVVRKLARGGVKINEQGDGEGQKKIFDEYMRLLSTKQDYISDRCMIDVLAYTTYLQQTTGLREFIPICQQQTKLVQEFFLKHDDIIICYFPIEFDIVDDGVRSTDESFRAKIDEIIRYILMVYTKKYYTISGNTEDRYKQIDKILREHGGKDNK